MAGLRDMTGEQMVTAAKGQVSQGFGVMKQKLAEGADKVAGWARGADGAPQPAAQAAPQPRAPAGTIFDTVDAAKAQNGLRSAADTPVMRTVAQAYNDVPAGAQGQPQMRTPPQTPEGIAAQQAKGLRDAARAAPPAPASAPAAAPAPASATPAAPAKAGLRSTASKVMRGAGVLATGLAAADAGIKASQGETPEQLRGGSAVQGGATEFYDNALFGKGREFAHGVKGALGAVTGDGESYDKATGEFVENARPAGVRAGLMGVVDRFAKGWSEGAAMEGRPAAAAPRAGSVQPPMPPASPVDAGMAAPKASAPGADNMVDTLSGGRVTADQLIDGTAVPAYGQGAIRRGDGSAVAVGMRSADVQPEARQRTDEYGRPINDIGKAYGALAMARAHQARDSGKVAEAELGVKQANAGTAAARLRSEQRDKRAADVPNEIKAEVMRDPALTSIKDPKEREAAALERTSDLEARMRRTAASGGKQLGDIDVVERRQMIMADNLRRRLEESRSSMDSFMRDFVGNKRFDSQNLYDYMPKEVEDAPFGRIVTMRNDNTVRVRKVVRNGESNWFSPNGPIDADMMALIEAAPKKGQK